MLHRIRHILITRNLLNLLKYANFIQKFEYCSFNNVDKRSIEKYVNYLQKEFNKISETKSLDYKNELRIKELTSIMQIIKERNNLFEHMSNLDELAKENDEEMKKLAIEEQEVFKEKIQTIEEQLIQSLVPKDVRDLCDSIVLEINAGVGGQEAMLFANELFEMYLNFANFKGWSTEIAEFDATDLGGLRHASIFINGKKTFQYFKYEAGVHRVQRIPTTERAGRIHTSTVSIIVLPQPRDIDITLHDKDLKIETKRASGAGGQHVNTTDSAVRIVHLPTGISVDCQVERSQIKNRQIAMQKLKALLYDQNLNEQIAENEALRKSQVKSSNRNEKIRTYNFSQDRITDHRLQGSNFHNLKGFLLGGEPLETLINKLHFHFQNEALMSLLSSVKE